MRIPQPIATAKGRDARVRHGLLFTSLSHVTAQGAAKGRGLRGRSQVGASQGVGFPFGRGEGGEGVSNPSARAGGRMELRAELTGRDGLKRPLQVRCEPQGELRALLRGLAQLREQVAAMLGPLVEQESGAGSGDRGGPEGEEDEDDEDEENHLNAKSCIDGPPLKRTKRHS
ncbi:hypothetical protein JRQ81_001077 [Phrynocephalus forsythii]|uniref:EKC/KEOPS complex subunit GON7 n=1 Tax=Phrynocephalus forsythii TaxID=171643 RepID=A0A9Q0Y754_9SAUR|nr:hypothetical protein JRQ81_001077 [Phrynocephalus forsythii]